MILTEYEKLFSALPAGVSDADAHYEMRNELCAVYSGGSITDASSRHKQAIYVRATTGGTGIAYTERADMPALDMLKRAMESAGLGDKDERDVFPKGDESDYDESRMEFIKPKISELKQRTLRIAQAMHAYDEYINYIDLRRIDQYDEIVNSNGVKSNRYAGYYSLELQFMCNEGTMNGEKTMAFIFNDLQEPDFANIAANMTGSVKLLSDAQEVESNTCDIILSSTAASKFLFCLSLALNAQRKKNSGSCFGGKEGEKIGAECISVFDGPSHALCPAVFNVDNEGCGVRKTALIKDGVFRSFLHNSSTAGADGTATTGNAGRRAELTGAIQARLMVTPKVMYIEPGCCDESKLLADLGNGIYIEDILDNMHGFDYPSGDFATPVTAIVVKNGKKVKGVTSALWMSNILSVLADVEAVGSEMLFEGLNETFEHSFVLGAAPILVRRQMISGTSKNN
mgnify:CR=1 FL=1